MHSSIGQFTPIDQTIMCCHWPFDHSKMKNLFRAAERGLLIMLDNHRITPGGGISELWLATILLLKVYQSQPAQKIISQTLALTLFKFRGWVHHFQPHFRYNNEYPESQVISLWQSLITRYSDRQVQLKWMLRTILFLKIKLLQMERVRYWSEERTARFRFMGKFECCHRLE